MTSFNYRSLAALGLLITLVACEKSNGAGHEADAVRNSSNEQHAEAALLMEAAVKETVQKYLKDPQSAQFKVLLISDSGQQACTVWNAKNGFGGYSEWKTAWLTRENNSWRLEDLDFGSIINCSDPAFKASVKSQETRKSKKLEIKRAAEVLAISAIQKARQISIEQADVVAKADCKSLVEAFVFKSLDLSIPERQKFRPITEPRYKEYMNALEGADCKKYTEVFLNSQHLEDCLRESDMGGPTSPGQCRSAFSPKNKG